MTDSMESPGFCWRGHDPLDHYLLDEDLEIEPCDVEGCNCGDFQRS